MNKLILKPGREKSLKRRHPWVFSGAIAQVEGNPESGETVEVRSSCGRASRPRGVQPALADPRPRLDLGRRRDRCGLLCTAHRGRGCRRRAALRHRRSRATRCVLVHGESDGLPGVVADRYGETAVMQILSAGAERWREAIADGSVCACRGSQRVWERSDADVRELEGLQAAERPRARQPAARRARHPRARAQVQSRGRRRPQDRVLPRPARQPRCSLRKLAAGKDVLDCFSYTGGFAINALHGGAKSVLAIDSSALALDIGARQCEAQRAAGRRVARSRRVPVAAPACATTAAAST